MKQIAIISGKGGTGKTTVTAAFAELAEAMIVADCDVEAPNLHLVLDHKVKKETEYVGNQTARIDYLLCSHCRRCEEVCRYEAITEKVQVGEGIRPDEFFPFIDSKRCEGCAACVYACPTQAIKLYPEGTGKVFLSETAVGDFAHAELYLAADGSGKLVAEVRRLARDEARRQNKSVLIDGSPGIGCVVISTITGCQQVIVVTEPSQSGKHDLERVIKLTGHFKIPTDVIINKWDINLEVSQEIEELCLKLGVAVIGRIPFDPMVPQAIALGHPITRYECPAAEALRVIWGNLLLENEH
ncbi:CobQ/CobB/MinD/ParA nucleotide binding domain protein [Candidatus Desulfosporosinus infrequens]|uniref:CobQ/CobB/MinD/ParA nucleotide binding domain protein n=1 Tax=Candidatus Desulfosporosinus infrequens TaxID=2043169 RepID=A0A2U3KGI5_9FIRM|nr:CobQ/CobB/MinD/ParA nucleotide binding domain protein [Candidatus Desulfosporosinus infrequens]